MQKRNHIKRAQKRNKFIFQVAVSIAVVGNILAGYFIISNNAKAAYDVVSSNPSQSFISTSNILLHNGNYIQDVMKLTTLGYIIPNSEISTLIDTNLIPIEEIITTEIPMQNIPEIEPTPPPVIIEEEVIEVPVERTPIAKLTKNTDLCAPIDITVEEMDAYIAAFGNTSFKGYGQYFIDASEATGLNPLYLFGHASLESGFGSSSLARNKGNYFGIGAYDSDPYNLAYVMGDTMYDGIIQGAGWIKAKYYDAGQTTLYTMIYGPKCYASSKDDWIWQIASLANQKLSVINDNR